AVIRIAHYRIKRVLGESAFGRVYLAEDDARLVAIRVPREESFGGAPEEIERYVAEARRAAAIEHPNIAAIYEVAEPPPPPRDDDGGAEIPSSVVSRSVGGPSLRAGAKESSFSFTDSAHLVVTVAEALPHAHASGLYHRGIDPEHILFDAAGDTPVVVNL